MRFAAEGAWKMTQVFKGGSYWPFSGDFLPALTLCKFRRVSHTSPEKQPHPFRSWATHWKFLFNDICTRHRVTFIEEEFNCSTTETSCELLRIRTRACAPWNWNCAVHTIPFERCWTRQKGEGYAPEGRYRGEESRKREGHQGFRGDSGEAPAKA